MPRRPLRVATIHELARSAREAGFETHVFPRPPGLDFHRSVRERLDDGPEFRRFLERHDIELVVDFNTAALTFTPSSREPGNFAITTAELGIPYVAAYLDPITSTMSRVAWPDHWHILENPTWIKWVWESAHAEELTRFGVPNVLAMPMAAYNDDFDTTPATCDASGPAVAFMGHPASSWFVSQQPVDPSMLVPAYTAAAACADMPDLPFHKVYFDLYEFGAPPSEKDDRPARAAKALEYYQRKFAYNAYLAVRQRDRFARFLKLKLGSAFELIGDHWKAHCGLEHTPRVWDFKELHERMRRVPICLNLMKGCLETGMNLRHFEIPAYGGFMLTYASRELKRCFRVGEECDVFHSEEELLHKIAHYLDKPKRRRDVALAGQRRVHQEHLYSHRLTALVHELRRTGWLPRVDAGSARGENAVDRQIITPLNSRVERTESRDVNADQPLATVSSR